MERTPSGKVLVYKADGSEVLERWAVDAREMVATGAYTFTKPDAEPTPADAKLPPDPNLGKTVEVPINPVLAKAGVTLDEVKQAGGEIAPGAPATITSAGADAGQGPQPVRTSGRKVQ